MTVVRRAPDLDRRVSSLPSPQESSSFAGPEYLSNGDSHMFNSDRPLGTSSRGLPSYGLTEPICNLTPASPSTARQRRRLVAGDGPLGLTRRSHVNPGTVHQADLRTEVSPAPASAFAVSFRRAQATRARVGRMLDHVYVGLSIPVPSSTAMTAASATRYQMNTVMLCLATNRSNQAIDA